MSLNAAVIDALVENGVTVEQLAAAMKADLAEGEARKQAKREKDAARQRKSRASRNVTVTACDTADVTLNGSQAKNPSPDPNHKTQPSNPPLKGSPPKLLPEHVLEAWNAMADRCGLSKAKLTPERRRKLASQIRQRSIEDWTEAIDAVERSSFLRGENDRAWRADFDFLLQPKSFTKLTEGSYDRSAH